jgi:REP element-mobilizing transposase RayT
MARKPRLHVKGGLYHVMLYGNGGSAIYHSDADCCRFYLLLQEGIERYGHKIHGFCLMPNHLHLAVQVENVPLSKIMQNLSFRYTRWVNQQLGRVGHLFQGRYQAVLVDSDTYLPDLVRYIHLNPVRCELVKDPKDYPWSGHLAYLGEEELPWLTMDPVLDHFGAKRPITSRKRYESFVLEAIKQGYREDFHRGSEDDARILGEERFVERVLRGKEGQPKKRPMALEVVINRVCKVYGVTEKDLQMVGRRRDWAEARSVIAYAAVVLGSSTLTEVADRFRRDVATLSTGVRRITTKLKAGRASIFASKALDRLQIDYS